MSPLPPKFKNLLFVLGPSKAVSQRLCRLLPAEKGKIHTRSFPDGETYLRVLWPCRGRHVAIFADLVNPDTKILKLAFLSETLRAQGARSVGMIVPYLPYMRQDRSFHKGESITSRIFAKIISTHCDWLVTVDPHLHRFDSLAEIYSIPTRIVPAAPVIARWIQQHVQKPVLIGPDGESTQWVSQIAEAAKIPSVILSKKRHGDRDVSIASADLGKWLTHTPILVDDIISTGHTMMATMRHLKQQGFKAPICIGVHALFAGNASDELLTAGAAKIVTCNTVAHASNAIDLSSGLAETVRGIFGKALP